jgi:hypothetical protein
MKWFQRNSKIQTDSREHPTADRTPKDNNELTLLLLRPSLVDLFINKSENVPIDADVICTSSGMVSTQGMPKWAIERIPVLGVTETGIVGYTFPMRLDIHLRLHELAKSSKTPIEFPYGLFTNRDVLVVTQGYYYVLLFHHTANAAMQNLKDGAGEFPASKIIYCSTTIDEGAMINLRRLEATAEKLLTPEPATLPKLPAELIDGWKQDFLGPIFEHVKEKLN